MLKGFKELLLRGNVLDLAVAFVIGAAFTAIVTALVDGVINPVIGSIFDAESLKDSMDVAVGSATIKFGVLVAAVINFLLIAAVVYFGLVVPINRLKKFAFHNKPVEGDASVPTELDMLTNIRDLLAKAPTEGDERHTSPTQ